MTILMVTWSNRGDEQGNAMKKLILLFSCLILAAGQTFSLAACAHLANVKAFNDNKAITNATSFINTTGDGTNTDTTGQTRTLIMVGKLLEIPLGQNRQMAT